MTKWFKNVIYLIAALELSSANAQGDVEFFRALQLDNSNAVAGLLLSGFDPNARDEKGQPALLLAMREEAFKSAELLLTQRHLEIDATNPAKETALMMAALKGHTDWCRRLIDRGAQVNREGWSALHYAATGPQPQASALLLERGAAIDARAPNGNTPLMMAALYGKEETVRLLLARGADRQLRNRQDRTAAELARGVGRDFLAPLLEPAAR